MTDTWQHGDFAAISWDDLSNLVTMASTGQWDPVKNPALKETFDRAAALKDAGPGGQPVAAPAEPPLPPGQFARVELPGYRNHTGWVTEETRFGAQTAVVRDWDGREIAAVALGPGCQVLFLPTPLRRPEPELAALPAGAHYGDEMTQDEAGAWRELRDDDDGSGPF